MKIWRPYTQEQQATAALKVCSAEGAYLHLENGQKVFDGIASWWLITHGHGQREIGQAIAEQSQSLAQTVFANFTHQPAQELCAELGQVLPASLAHMFFSDNGSTAVEVAMKMAYQFCAQSGKPQRRKFLTFDRAYHGDTCGAMSVSQRGMFTSNYAGLLFEVVRCKQGQWSQDPLATWLEDFHRHLAAASDEVCAVILEPLIQGAGGMIVWPLEAIRTICAEAHAHGILVIFDEVMTGFGRTGSLFAFQEVGFTPDLLCLSKGLTAGFLPMGLTVASAEVYSTFLGESSDKMLFHGHSFTGNALSCAAAVANLKLWRQSEMATKLRVIHEAQHTALQAVPMGLPIRDIRVCGTIGVLELDLAQDYGGRFSRELHTLCLERGLFIRTLGSTIYLMPPYCTTEQEIQQAWDTIFTTVLRLV